MSTLKVGEIKHESFTGTTQLKLDSAGRLGIGTTSPSNALDVQGGATNTAIVARSTDSKAQISLVDNSTTSVGSVVVGAEGDALFLTSGSGGAEAMRIDSSGRLLYGHTSNVTGSLFQINSGANFFAASNDANGAVVDLIKTRSTTPSGNTILQDGDKIGELRFRGNTGAGYVNGAVIQAIVNGTPGSGNDLPTDLVFRLQPDGSGNTFEPMRIASSGNVGIGTTSPEKILHVKNGSSGSSYSADGADLLIIENNDSVGIDLRSPASNSGNIFFSDANARSQGRIFYDHNNDSLSFCSNGVANERIRINSSGTMLHGSGAIVTPKVSAGGLDIACNNNSIVFGADSNSGNPSQTRTNNALKDQRIAAVHYTNAEEPVGVVRVLSDSSTSECFFGGGSSLFNAATQLSFYTASNNTTTSGSERIRITNAGHFLFSCTSHLDSTDTGIKFHESSSVPYMTNTIDSSSSNHSFYHLYNKNSNNNGYRFYVQQNGGVYNFSGNNYNLSDEREKKNITLMGSVYNTFKQFVFKDFNYISEDDSVTKKHGLIAQDVESIDSDLVSEDFKASVDSEGNDVLRKGLREEQFMMIGFKALQEAIAKIEVSETKVAALEAALQEAIGRIEVLEAK